MKSYRIYFTSRDGRLQLGQAFEAQDDQAAGARAEVIAEPGRACEVWEGGRLVGCVAENGVFASGDRPSA